MAPSTVLRTRLRAPRIPEGALVRDELIERAARALSTRLLSVVAGAGYGKSRRTG